MQFNRGYPQQQQPVAGRPAAGSAFPDLVPVNVDGAPDDSVSALRFSAPGSPVPLLGCTSWDGTVRLWQVDENPQNPSARGFAMKNAQAPQLALSISGGGKVFFGGVDRRVSMWDLSSEQVTPVGEHQLAVSAVTFCERNLNMPLLVSGSWDGVLSFWDLRAPQPVKQERLGGPIFAVDGQGSSPMLTVAVGRKIVTYDLQSGAVFAETPAHNLSKYHIRCVANWGDSSCFAAGYAEGRISVHPTPNNPTAAKYGCCFKAHTNETGTNKFTMHQVNFLKQLPQSHNCVISGGGDGRIKLWRVDEKRKLYENKPVLFCNEPIPITAGDLNAAGNILAYAYSYDWGMGKDGFNPQMPRAICLSTIPMEWK